MCAWGEVAVDEEEDEEDVKKRRNRRKEKISCIRRRTRPRGGTDGGRGEQEDVS